MILDDLIALLQEAKEELGGSTRVFLSKDAEGNAFMDIDTCETMTVSDESFAELGIDDEELSTCEVVIIYPI